METRLPDHWLTMTEGGWQWRRSGRMCCSSADSLLPSLARFLGLWQLSWCDGTLIQSWRIPLVVPGQTLCLHGDRQEGTRSILRFMCGILKMKSPGPVLTLAPHRSVSSPARARKSLFTQTARVILPPCLVVCLPLFLQSYPRCPPDEAEQWSTSPIEAGVLQIPEPASRRPGRAARQNPLHQDCACLC